MYELTQDDSKFIRNHYGGKLPVALDENSTWIKPDKGVHGWCPECGGYVISKISDRYDKKGRPQRRNHFAHYPANPDCSIHNREESLWHLRQKAVFPIDWCEKTVIKSKGQNKKNRHRFVDVYSNEAKYTLEFESNISGRDLIERDQFYTDCNVRTSWVFKSSISSARKKLEIIPLTDDTLHHLKARQMPRKFYQDYIDKPIFRGVLVRGDIPLTEHTTLAGMTFLVFSEALYLAVCPDKNERFKIDTSQEYILGNLMSPANFLRIFRPYYKVEAQLGDESAIRMDQWAKNAAKKLIDAGGEYKLVGAGKKSACFFENRKVNKQELAGEIIATIDKVTGQDIVDLYEADGINELIECMYEAEDMGAELMRKLRYEAKKLEIERQELAQYKRGNITPSIIDLAEFENIDPGDHSTFSEWEEEYTLEAGELDKVLDSIEKELESYKLQKQVEEENRKRLAEIDRLILKARQFFLGLDNDSVNISEQLLSLTNSLKHSNDMNQAFEVWKEQVQQEIDRKTKIALVEKEQARQAQISQYRRKAINYLKEKPFFKDNIDKYLDLYDEIALLPGTPNELAEKWLKQCKKDEKYAKEKIVREQINKELEQERQEKERVKALELVELKKEIAEYLEKAKVYLQTLTILETQKEKYYAQLVTMMKVSTYAASTYYQWKNTVVDIKL